MIYDRTSFDVEQAKIIRDQKVQNFLPLTESEIQQLERGMLTINTLNRIEDNQARLKQVFNSLGYWDTPIITRMWDSTDIFDRANFDRIVQNLDILREAFFTFTNTPSTPAPKYHFSNINDIEKILYDLNVILADMQSRYQECGAFECGQEEKFERLYR